MRLLLNILIPSALLATATAALVLSAQAAPESSPPEQASSPFSDDANQPAPELAKLYFGASICKRCHAEPADRDQEFLTVCRCNEFTTWQNMDKHKNGYQVLLQPRAERMGKLLNLKGSVTKEKDCLACHAAYVADDEKDESFRVEEGVSCAICHGPYEEWVGAHAPPLARQRKTWRDTPPKERQAKYGMVDLHDPVTRSAVCTSCHIGNEAEGKVVTHEMYAAGHPPLSGVEIATYSDQMHRHWQYPKEKTAAVRKLLQVPAGAKFEESQLVLIGGVAAFRQTMALLAAQAADADVKWPPLAQFDCYACHHELQLPSWRQNRDAAGTPGRPQSRDWPTVLVRLALYHLGQSEEPFDTRLKALRQAFDARAFGNREQIASAAKDLTLWADELSVNLVAAPLNPSAVRKLMQRLGELPDQAGIDYDSARQMAWAFQTFYRELPGASAERWTAAAGELESLDLSLSPADTTVSDDTIGSAGKRNAFDPKLFRNDMGRLLELLETAPAAPGGT